MSDWLRRCSTWQFVLVWDGVIVLAILGGTGAAQFIWHHHHLDPGALLGAALGGGLGSTVMAIVYRQGRKYRAKSHRR